MILVIRFISLCFVWQYN